jgi:hypothetical protein
VLRVGAQPRPRPRPRHLSWPKTRADATTRVRTTRATCTAPTPRLRLGETGPSLAIASRATTRPPRHQQHTSARVRAVPPTSPRQPPPAPALTTCAARTWSHAPQAGPGSSPVLAWRVPTRPCRRSTRSDSRRASIPAPRPNDSPPPASAVRASVDAPSGRVLALQSRPPRDSRFVQGESGQPQLRSDAQRPRRPMHRLRRRLHRRTSVERRHRTSRRRRRIAHRARSLPLSAIAPQDTSEARTQARGTCSRVAWPVPSRAHALTAAEASSPFVRLHSALAHAHARALSRSTARGVHTHDAVPSLPDAPRGPILAEQMRRSVAGTPTRRERSPPSPSLLGAPTVWLVDRAAVLCLRRARSIGRGPARHRRPGSSMSRCLWD